MTSDECKAACAGHVSCIGFSHYAANSRCAIWVDLNNMADRAGWAAFPGTGGWVVNTSVIIGGSGDAGWTCWERNSYIAPQDPIQTTAPPPAPATTTTTAAPPAPATTTAKAVNDFTWRGNGICTNSVYQSPPNYSRDGIANDAYCAAYCVELADCIGFSWTAKFNRCALWMNLTNARMTDKAGWEIHLMDAAVPGSVGWSTSTSQIQDVLVRDGYTCYTKNPGVISTTTIASLGFTLKGDGICTAADKRNHSINYSATLDEPAICALYCKDTADCSGFSFSAEYKRCALWIDNHYAPGLAGFDKYDASYFWDQGTMKVEESSGHTQWKCYLK